MLKKSKRGIRYKPQKAVFDLFHVATISHRTKTTSSICQNTFVSRVKDISSKTKLMKSFNRHFNIRMKTWHGLYPAVTVGYLLGKLKKNKTKQILISQDIYSPKHSETEKLHKDQQMARYSRTVRNISHVIMNSIQRKQQ